MYLGIEIGGTKIQLGIGRGAERSSYRTHVSNYVSNYAPNYVSSEASSEAPGSKLLALERFEVDPSAGAVGIRHQIVDIGKALIERYPIQRIGIGFGGPVDVERGRTITSFHIDGWDDFPLCQWCQDSLGLPASLENDSNLAGLGEARQGAGKGHQVVFYSNVGSGIGGALVLNGQLYGGGSGVAVMEVGHLRPGVSFSAPDQTVESIASGWSLASRAKKRVREIEEHMQSGLNDEELGPIKMSSEQLLARSSGSIDGLTGKMVVDAALEGNVLAEEIFHQAIQTYGWGLAQVITLLSPNVVVVGGGVPQVGEGPFFNPLRREVQRYVLPALHGTYRIVPAQLGEEVVLYGALALAEGA